MKYIHTPSRPETLGRGKWKRGERKSEAKNLRRAVRLLVPFSCVGRNCKGAKAHSCENTYGRAVCNVDTVKVMF